MRLSLGIVEVVAIVLKGNDSLEVRHHHQCFVVIVASAFGFVDEFASRDKLCVIFCLCEIAIQQIVDDRLCVRIHFF